MENSNSGSLNMEEYNKFLKTIKAGSPVHKINFSLESPNAIVGMYLITMENVESYLDKVADYSDLSDNTLLVFESRHVIECCQIIYGCLNMLKGIGMYRMDYKVFINQIIDTLLSKPTYYDHAVKELSFITDNYIKLISGEESIIIHKRFAHIMKNIWFVPYGSIDEMANEAIDEFKKQLEGEK